MNMDDSSNLSCVVLYFPQFSSSTSAPCARRRNVNKKPCECSSREYFQPNSHTPSYRHTVQFRSSRPTRNRSRPLTECEYISLSTILLLLQLLLLLLILQTQLVIILLYYYHYYRPDLKSDIWTIMDPVRLDLRNKFYLARNYQKCGGRNQFSHDFVYKIYAYNTKWLRPPPGITE